ncbi:MAG TPA: FGGY family carbohydrate kinase [Aggregatilineaceae bacterium]|nr:FGGY family carbohydrate kinase [Aggregatilineaceae bacterium]
MKLVSVDVGTTSCKAGLFDGDGAPLRIASRPTPTRTASDGAAYYAPDELWEAVCAALREAVADVPGAEIAVVGVTSMAESGVVIGRTSGAARSDMLPWFDNRAAAQAEWLSRQDEPLARFVKTGLHPGPKVSLAKLLWLLRRDPAALDGGVWLSAADYIVFRLTGALATDYSLAGRTFAFRIDRREWDHDWVRGLGLPPDLFPPARPSGEPAGRVHAGGSAQSGLPVGAPVAVAGHDHLCAALGVGAVTERQAFDSMGTAEVLLGALERRDLTRAEFESGLSFGAHVVPERGYWLGGSMSGGSVEWLRTPLGSPPISYRQLDDLLAAADEAPTEILYYPYLLGGASSSLNQRLTMARAAFVGLGKQHGQADLLKAVLQGTAYEMERIRRTAEQLTGAPIERALAAGGGTRNRLWMQIKADVSNCVYEVPPLSDVTLLGAAMIAGVGAGLFAGVDEAVAALAPPNAGIYRPDAGRHRRHVALYEEGYLPLMTSLNAYYALLEKRPYHAHDSA